MLPAEKAFSDRGLDWELAAKLGATYAAGQFLFDYRKAGKLLFRKVRTDDKRFWIEPAGVPLQFWGLDEVPVLPGRPAEALVITEGEADRIAVLQACGGYALSVPNGAPGQRTEGTRLVAQDKGFSYLWGKDERLIPEVDQFNKIILFTDADEPGTILRDELSMRIGPSRCWFIPYPEGTSCKDANDILRRWGIETLQRAVCSAKPMRPGHLVSFKDLPPRKNEKIYDTGWKWLDKHLQFVRPQLLVVTGIPNHGKGAWTRALCANLALRHQLRTAFLVPEDPAHRVRRDLYRFALHKFSSPTGYQQAKAVDWVNDWFRISITPEDEDITIELVEAEMASAALHHNCQIFVVDPWNEIAHQLDRQTETQYIERIVVRLKRLARRYGLLLIIVAHPRKIVAGTEPDLYCISGSSNWKNKADHGVIIHRLADENSGGLSEVTNIIVEKSKDYETMGVPGRTLAKFDAERFDYVSAEFVVLTAEQPAEETPIMDASIPF